MAQNSPSKVTHIPSNSPGLGNTPEYAHAVPPQQRTSLLAQNTRTSGLAAGNPLEDISFLPRGDTQKRELTTLSRVTESVTTPISSGNLKSPQSMSAPLLSSP